MFMPFLKFYLNLLIFFHLFYFIAKGCYPAPVQKSSFPVSLWPNCVGDPRSGHQYQSCACITICAMFYSRKQAIQQVSIAYNEKMFT